MAMEFWGLEVQPGQTVKVNPGKNKYLHLSQVSLGEIKKEKGAEGASVFVKFDDKKLVLGTLYADKYSESESDEGNPLDVPINGKLEVKRNDKAAMPNAQKAEASDGKSKAKIEKSKKDDKLKAKAEDDDDSEEDESDDDEDDEVGPISRKHDHMLILEIIKRKWLMERTTVMMKMRVPKKRKKLFLRSVFLLLHCLTFRRECGNIQKCMLQVEVGNKRPANSSSKTPVPEKKAKLVSSGGNQKSGADGKKGGHIATPYPAKQGKTPANSVDKLKQQAPKPAGSVSCKSCSKTFNSENALQSHTKAKHSGN
ncbi:hypothetical protein ZIOFF_031105 [Zingiber officinale]|uniref:C2H2-type domain-containing protein n=1 Tax=Zingiber officinale TaxID=94328 RepID=A0A8J5LCB9_ZINOF|nr:hypothetical protein ZIOFF_031105 [Zingiber officinale]